MLRVAPILIAASLVLLPAALHANNIDISLRGSRASMVRQNQIARAESYSFLRTPAQVRRFVDDGRLLPLTGNADYAVIAGHPFARPAVRSLIERLAGSYHTACGEKLVVTSLTRPAAQQPRNASPLSVHPAGMAVDLRVSKRASCSSWLKSELLRLEELGVLDATLEQRPPHFHVAVFPTPFAVYEQAIAADSIAVESIRLLEEAVTARAQGVEQEQPAASDEAGHERVPMLAQLLALIALLILPIAVAV